MTRPSKKTIEPLLDEYARLDAKRIGIELTRERELEPHKAAYERKAGPIISAAKLRLDAIAKRMGVLAGEIDTQMMAGVDLKAETVALAEVAVEIETTKSVALAVAALNKAEGETLRLNDENKPVVRAIASVDAKPGNRDISAEKFFDFVKAPERTGSFWSCMKVLIGNAEKFLGKEKIDVLAKQPKSYSVSIKLKP